MNMIIFSLAACLLVGCGNMKPVEGAPEIQIRQQDTATITVQENGSRLVVIGRGEAITTIILLPPAKEATPKVTTPVLEK